MSFYERRLPHWHPEGVAIFLTWRLYDSYPAHHEFQRLPSNKRFVAIDRELDRAATGPSWLADPAIAACVANALRYGAGHLKLYVVYAWVIMCNHVHLLMQPHVPVSRITQAIKNYSAREGNKLLKRTGLPFWLDETYDHWIRDAKQFSASVRYIEFNPVAAGLVENPEDWQWSSASRAGQEACPTMKDVQNA